MRRSPGAVYRIAWPIGIVVIGLAVLVCVVLLMGCAGASDESTAAVGTAVASAVLLVGGLLLLRRLPPAQRRIALATKGRVTGAVGLGVAVGAGLVVAAGLVILAGGAIDPGVRDELDRAAVDIGDTWWQVALIIVSLVVLAPLGEELLFRGLVLRGLVRLMPLAWAAPLSGLIFTAAHADAWLIWPRAIALALTGWAVAWLYRRRGWWASVAAHTTVNGVAVIALLMTA